MKMIGSLFREDKLDIKVGDGGAIHCDAVLTPVMESPILAAHFPGHPIVPGACLIAAATELACSATGQNWRMEVLKNVKYISLVEPQEGEPLRFEMDIDSNAKKVKAVVKYCDAICCKMSMTCCTAS